MEFADFQRTVEFAPFAKGKFPSVLNAAVEVQHSAIRLLEFVADKVQQGDQKMTPENAAELHFLIGLVLLNLATTCSLTRVRLEDVAIDCSDAIDFHFVEHIANNN